MRAAILIVVGGFVSFFAAAGLADEVRDARKAVRALGMQVLGQSVELADESKLGKSLRETAKLKKTLFLGEKNLAGLNRRKSQTEKFILNWKRKYVQLNARLANINPNNVVLNNKIVGAVKAVAGQIELLNEQQEKQSKRIKQSRQSVSLARDAYIQHVLDMRTLADRISADYKSKAVEKPVQAAIARLNEASGKTYQLAPSRFFQSGLRRLKSLEDTVLSEAIPLRRTVGNSLYVSVNVNGKYTQEMILDSGASLVVLPHRQAEDFGLNPGSNDPTIRLRLADGSIIQGKLMKLSELRVGKFTVKDVDCAVLGREADGAESLLGMSFLSNFKFEIDAQAGTLTMVKVEASSKSSSRRPSRKRR